MYKKLKRRKIIRNIIEGILCITFIVLTVIYIFKYKNSRIDKITEQVILGKVVGTKVTTTYNEKYSSIYFRFIMAFCVSLVILITDIICSGFIDISSKEDKIYIYKGLFLLGLYVNGELADYIILNYRTHLKSMLSDGSIIYCYLDYRCINISFSNTTDTFDVTRRDLIK